MLGKLVRRAREGVYSYQRAQVRPKKRGTGKSRKPRAVKVKRPKAALTKRQLQKDIMDSSRSVLNAKLI